MIGGRKIEDYTKRLYNRLENEKNTLTNHVYIYIYIYIYILYLKRVQVKIKYPNFLKSALIQILLLYIYISNFLSTDQLFIITNNAFFIKCLDTMLIYITILYVLKFFSASQLLIFTNNVSLSLSGIYTVFWDRFTMP